MANFITQAELQAMMTPALFLAIFDDDNNGSVDAADTNAAQIIALAHAEVISYVPNLYEDALDELPSGVPDLLKSVELDYAYALSLNRHPEFARFESEYKQRWERAEKKMDRISKSIQRIAGSNAPTADPANVGATVAGPDPLDRDDVTKIFADGMGDF